MIPITDPKRQFTALESDIFIKIMHVLKKGTYISGENVTQLESVIADRLGVKEAIAVANGTDALVLTLHAYNIGPGDEVVTTPFSFFATAEAISRVGATPIFADIDPTTFNLDPAKVREKISKRTKAILPVHLFGQPADMQELNKLAKEHNILVIEDACQAFGAVYQGKEVGSLGDAACFSFFPTKNLSTMGDGGLVTTSDKTLAKRIRELKTHGSKQKYFHSEIGYNSRLDEIHAAILLCCLKNIDEWNQMRGNWAVRYQQKLKDLTFIESPKTKADRKHVYHLYTISTERRQELMEHLTSRKVQTGIYYPQCIHLQEAYQHLSYRKGDFPKAEQLSERLLALPLFPHMTEAEQDVVIEALKEFQVMLS
ncbi:DegT/DnrJ/EryC1/StrS family aminotransferase [Oceanobacillus manasiensis]|uniref:DegT/DnrJ/EryC1/StrS family aminotransferase n=1 Tax=Oceanobacillus manasiensis TaxID=586413 RepID=UPI0005A62A35|nr:DegT/DnrJ/EryC1/StrS family aminotransferase [Oceanobacillus manasiensis]